MIINSIVNGWVVAIGGVSTIYNILSLLFVFTLLWVFYKVTT